jgi:hypothetical protein
MRIRLVRYAQTIYPYSLGTGTSEVLRSASSDCQSHGAGIVDVHRPAGQIEEQGKALSIDARLKLRVEQSQSALNALHEWLIQTRIQTSNGGGAEKALDYTLKRWPSLIRNVETGLLPIDNNPVETPFGPLPWA